MSPELRIELDAAVDAYSRECERLIGAHERRELPKEWLADEHGEHCRFEHATSGHVVEAPLSWFASPHFAIDPYFFAVFVKTGPGFPLLKKANTHEFHDALALLDARKKEKKNADPVGTDNSGAAPRRV